MSSCASPAAPGGFAVQGTTDRGGMWRIVIAALLALAAIPAGAGAAHGAPPQHPCPAGSFCSWPEPSFTGQMRETAVQTTALERCVQLPQDWEVRSFANNTGHPVTVYQDPNCDVKAEFDTHPTGSQTPQASYVARAIKIWSH